MVENNFLSQNKRGYTLRYPWIIIAAYAMISPLSINNWASILGSEGNFQDRMYVVVGYLEQGTAKVRVLHVCIQEIEEAI